MIFLSHIFLFEKLDLFPLAVSQFDSFKTRWL